MKLRYRCVMGAALMSGCALCCLAGERPQNNLPAKASTATYIISNDDTAFPFPNSVSLFVPGGTPQNPDLTEQNSIYSPGYGIQGGYFGASRIISPADGSSTCLYMSDAATNDITAIDMQTQQVTGSFMGSANDSGSSNGIALAMNDSYLYAGFPDSNTIATFTVQAGCGLGFVSDVAAVGLNGGTITGMALNRSLLVVAYGDGSIESFNIAKGAPVSNGDKQNSTGYAYNNLPTGVDITSDGHFAIFGDTAVSSVVEVSDISSGKLKPTVAYPAGSTNLRPIPTSSSGSVRLSPDETLLFVSNNQGGSVTAASFNKATGQVFPGCTTPALSGYFADWAYTGSLVTRDNFGNGGVLYVAEYFTNASWIGIVEITSNGSGCSLKESPSSPVLDQKSFGLLSIWSYPPRQF